MKKQLLLTYFLLIVFLANSQQAFEIRGDVSQVEQKITMVHYRYFFGGIAVDDSATIRDKKYVLKGKTDEHVMVQMSAVYEDTSLEHDYRRDYHVIHITPGTKASIQHKNVFALSEIKGSAAQAEYETLHPRLVKGETDFIPDYIREHPQSPITLFLLNQFLIGPFLNVERHEPLYRMLSQDIRNTPSGKKLGNRLEAAKKTAIGRPAPVITQKDSTGKLVSLAQFKGKYVLLEFWASWCGPCRKENPYLVKTYETYRSKGFEIFGISIDENRTAWLKAVHKDGLPWINTADLLDWDKNPAALLYGVTAIPQNFLVGPDGIIIGSNLRGKNLENALEKIFGN